MEEEKVTFLQPGWLWKREFKELNPNRLSSLPKCPWDFVSHLIFLALLKVQTLLLPHIFIPGGCPTIPTICRQPPPVPVTWHESRGSSVYTTHTHYDQKKCPNARPFMKSWLHLFRKENTFSKQHGEILYLKAGWIRHNLNLNEEPTHPRILVTSLFPTDNLLLNFP